MHEQPINKPSIKAIILTASPDFGRCPAATRLPTALWPVAGKPVLVRLLTHLTKQGIKQVVVCSTNKDALPAESICSDTRPELKFLDEPLPVGTAGCIRDAVGDDPDSLVIVFSASVVCPPSVDTVMSAHRSGRSDLTVMFNPPNGNGESMEEAADIYVCNHGILEHIPKEGYFDIKEGLIPEMLRAGKTVHAARLPNHAGNFRDRQGYLHAIANYLENGPEMDTDLKLRKQTDAQTLWMAPRANVDSSTRIYGPVAIMDGASISRDVFISGPTVIGRNVRIDENSVVVNSTIWDGARIGANCQIQRCIVDYDATVPGNTMVQEQSIPFKPSGVLKSWVNTTLKVANSKTSKIKHALESQLDTINEKLPERVQPRRKSVLAGFAASFVLIVFLWSYWPNLKELWNIWQRSDEYSSGLLVPFLAVYILWSRRHTIAECPIRLSVWGLFAFMAAQAVRLFGLFLMYGSAERLCVILSIAALVLLLFGWQLFRKVSTILLFLCLMLPWPNRVQTAVTLPLQQWATSSAVFCLETMGYDAIQEGNVIHIGNASVAVAEACNGLRMITAFFVISGLVVLLVKRAWWEKLIILASSLPVALLCNTTRLTITALAFTVVSGEHWEKIFHDFGGYAMMPLALAIVVAELWLIRRLTTLPTKHEPIIVARQNR